jgi:hypothetical protein
MVTRFYSVLFISAAGSCPSTAKFTLLIKLWTQSGQYQQGELSEHVDAQERLPNQRGIESY